jgi:hypothetical protein
MREREKNRDKREKTDGNACEKSTKTKEVIYVTELYRSNEERY